VHDVKRSGELRVLKMGAFWFHKTLRHPRNNEGATRQPQARGEVWLFDLEMA
jgi:hypothetical protein